MARERLRYQWDRARARYVDTVTGRLVSDGLVRRALDRALAGEQARARSLALQYTNGGLDLRGFESGMREMIRNLHLYSAMVAKGGQAQMTQADYGLVGQEVRVQYDYLAGFVDDLRSGKQALDGSFTNRAVSYAGQGRKTYHRVDRQVKFAAGMTEERNRLHPADHCGECPFLSDLGWVPIGTLPPVGTRECLGGCLCTIEYRDGGPATRLTELELSAFDLRSSALTRRTATTTAAARTAHRAEVVRGVEAAKRQLATRKADAARRAPATPAHAPRGLYLPERPLGDTSPLAVADVVKRLQSTGLMRPTGYVLSKDYTDEGLRAHIPNLEDGNDPAHLLPGRRAPWEAGWGDAEIDDAHARAMAGRVVGTLEYLEQKYPGMVQVQPVDLLMLTQHEGGVTIAPESLSRYASAATKPFPTGYPTTVMVAQTPLLTTAEQTKWNEDAKTLLNKYKVPFSRWTTAHTGQDPAATDGVIRHETGHLMTTEEASREWEKVIFEAAKANAHQLADQFEKEPKPVQSALPVGMDSWRYEFDRQTFGMYSTSGPAEEIAEAAAIVSDPNYRPGTLPKAIEEFVAKLYNGEFFPGHHPFELPKITPHTETGPED